jgi:ATP-dependent helicase HepA
MDHFGMVAEAAEERTWVLRPDDVASVVLPEMPAEGMTVTADRARALAREDVGFLTVDHPLWQAALDALLGSEDGNACLAVAEGGVAALYCEAWYVAECVAPPALHLDRFFPSTPIRVLVDHRLEDLSADRALIGMKLVPSPDPAAIAAALLASGRLAALMETAERVAGARCGQLVEKARKAARAQFAAETARLADLARWPGHPAGAELEGLAAFAAATDAALSGSRLRLDALRIISRG